MSNTNTNAKTGHNENVTNLNSLIVWIPTFGAAYDPSNASLSHANLIILASAGQTVNTAVDACFIVWQNSVTSRSSVFEVLPSIMSRSINALEVSGAPDQTIAQGKALARDVAGRRASARLTEEEIAAEKALGIETRQVTMHKSSFNSKTDNFSKYVLFMAAVPEYIPNEVDITVAALQDLLADMKAENASILSSDTAHGAAISNRNVLLYKDDTGLVDTAIKVKKYIKSAFGVSSPQYKQISDLAFTKIK